MRGVLVTTSVALAKEHKHRTPLRSEGKLQGFSEIKK